MSSATDRLPFQSTAFFGREPELNQLDMALRDPACRLITLVGLGGMGKTRLALQACVKRAGDHPDGVRFVPLALIHDPEDMLSVIASVLDFVFVGESEMSLQLLRFLQERSLLLILDGFEHLLSASTFIDELLRVAPQVKLLVTSRLRLNLPDEKVIPIDGFQLPLENQAEPENSEAVQFFVECARRTKLGFSPNEEEAFEVARICRLLGGAPLGIELAAPWIKTLSCEEIRNEIEISLDFLASQQQDLPERHRSLRAVFEYSWSLLSENEKQALLVCSVFHNGFRPEAAEKVADCSLELLSALVEKSLLQRNREGRYEMQELIRQFSEEKLRESRAQYQSVRERHSYYFCNFVGLRSGKLKSQAVDETLKEIDAERANVQSAWKFAMDQQKVQLFDLAYDALFQYFEIKFLAKEGEEAFALAADSFAEADVPGVFGPRKIMAQALSRQGWFCYQQGRMGQAEELLQKSLSLAREIQEAQVIGEVLHFICPLYSFLRKYDQEEVYAKESLEIFKGIKDDWCIAWSLFHVAQKPKQDHDNETARKYLLESLRLFEKVGYPDGQAWNLNSLAQIALLEREFMSAKDYLNRSLSIFQRHENKVSAGMILLELAHLSADLDENEETYRLAQQAHRYFQSSNDRLRLAWAQLYCADSAFHMGEWGNSLKAGIEALRLFSEQEDLVGQGWTCANLCRTYNQNGRFSEGKVFGQKGVDVFARKGDREGLGVCQYYLGYSEMGLKSFDAAERFFLQGLENLLPRQIHWRLIDVILGLAELKVKKRQFDQGFFLASVVVKDPAIGSDLKIKAKDLIEETEPKLGQIELQYAQEKIKSLTTEELAAQLLLIPSLPRF